MDKPIQLKIEEARQEIINSINKVTTEKGLDYYFLYSIMKDIFNNIEVNKNIEISQLIEEEKNKDNKENKKSTKENKERK